MHEPRDEIADGTIMLLAGQLKQKQKIIGHLVGALKEINEHGEGWEGDKAHIALQEYRAMTPEPPTKAPDA